MHTQVVINRASWFCMILVVVYRLVTRSDWVAGRDDKNDSTCMRDRGAQRDG